MTRIATFITLLALSAPASAQVVASVETAKPILKREASIIGDVVRIGDLIENAGIVADVAIFRAPDLGDTGVVPVARVIDAVREHAIVGLNTNGLSEVTVTRISRVIPNKEIEARIAKALTAQYALGPVKDLAINFDRQLRTVHVEPSAQSDLRVSSLNYGTRNGRFDISFDVPGGSRALRYTGTAVATVETVTIVNPLNRGDLIKSADIVVERRPKAELANDNIPAADAAVGLAARRSLSAGQPLRTSDLMKPELVTRDSSVTLLYEVPGITLTVRGKAIEGGIEGDVINVLNIQSKRTVQGTVTGSGRVTVASRMPRIAANLEPSEPVPSNAQSERAE